MSRSNRALNETDNISDSPDANVNAPIFGYGTSATTAADKFTFSSTSGTTTPAITVTGGPFLYDGNSHAAAVAVTGSVSGDPNPSGTYGGHLRARPLQLSTPPTSAGTYAVNVSFTSTDPNYSSTTATGSLTINPALSAVSGQTIKAMQNISTGSVLLATFSVQTGQVLAVADFSGSVNWKDGSALDNHLQCVR